MRGIRRHVLLQLLRLNRMFLLLAGLLVACGPLLGMTVGLVKPMIGVFLLHVIRTIRAVLRNNGAVFIRTERFTATMAA